MSFIPSFANPVAFAGLLGIGLLYYAYRKARSSKKREVPSLFFIRQLELPRNSARNRKLPFRFYLESLIVLLLTLYLANPELPQKGRKVAILLDRSMSMGAVNSRGVSRYQEGTKILEKYIERELAGNQYALYYLPLWLNHERMFSDESMAFYSGKEIKNMASKHGTIPFPDALENSVPELTEHLVRSRFDEMVVVSDKSVSGTPHKSLKLTSLNTGTPENNFFLVSARTRVESTESVAVDIVYGFSGAGSTNITFRVKEISPNEKILGESQSVIQGGSEKIETIVLGNDLQKRSAILKIEGSSSPVRDSLKDDNDIYVVHIPNAGDESVIFISPDVKNDAPVRKSLEVALQSDLKHINCRQLAAFLKNRELRNAMFIYYKCPAPETLHGGTLVVLPSQSGRLVPVQSVQSKPRITSWNSAHQITRYLKLSLLAVPDAVILGEVPWGSAVLSSSEGPLLLSGSFEGNKIIVSGMELLPFEGSRNRAGSILLLNILSVLRSHGEDRIQSNWSRDQFSELKQLTPARLKDDEKSNIPESGVYKGILKEGGQKKIFSIQNFFQEESDLYTPVTHSFSNDMVQISEDVTTSHARYLLYASLFLLLLDLLLLAVLRREV
jgi:hypothetical protein